MESNNYQTPFIFRNLQRWAFVSNSIQDQLSGDYPRVTLHTLGIYNFEEVLLSD